MLIVLALNILKNEIKMLLSWFGGPTPIGTRSDQIITLPAASIHPIMGLLVITLQMRLVKAQTF
jgi:hypothetical protein